jgi:hypothetical protein
LAFLPSVRDAPWAAGLNSDKRKMKLEIIHRLCWNQKINTRGIFQDERG